MTEIILQRFNHIGNPRIIIEAFQWPAISAMLAIPKSQGDWVRRLFLPTDKHPAYMVSAVNGNHYHLVDMERLVEYCIPSTGWVVRLESSGIVGVITDEDKRAFFTSIKLN